MAYLNNELFGAHSVTIIKLLHFIKLSTKIGLAFIILSDKYREGHTSVTATAILMTVRQNVQTLQNKKVSLAYHFLCGDRLAKIK